MAATGNSQGLATHKSYKKRNHRYNSRFVFYVRTYPIFNMADRLMNIQLQKKVSWSLLRVDHNLWQRQVECQPLSVNSRRCNLLRGKHHSRLVDGLTYVELAVA